MILLHQNKRYYYYYYIVIVKKGGGEEEEEGNSHDPNESGVAFEMTNKKTYAAMSHQRTPFESQNISKISH